MLTVETHAASHVGRVRKGNEDNYLLLNVADSKSWTSAQDAGDLIIESQNFEIDDKGIVLAVSDGMGGALAGEVASKMAVETVSQRFLNDNEDDSEKKLMLQSVGEESLISRLYDATVYANALIHRQGRSDARYNGMGATFTGMGITPEAVDLVQVGDSRAYLIRNAKIYQITKDQSLVQQLIDSGQIKPEEAETHQLKNVILQALGAQNEIYPVAARLLPQREDVLLICSDGLSNKIGGADMQKIILKHFDQLKSACAELIETANERGGEDNISLILARLSGDALPESKDENINIELLNLDDIHDTADQNTAEMNIS